MGTYYQPPPSAASLPAELRQQSMYATSGQDLEFHPAAAASRLNPRAPDFPPQALKPQMYPPYLGQVGNFIIIIVLYLFIEVA